MEYLLLEIARDFSVFYLIRHLTSKRADLARLGGGGGKLQGQVHLTFVTGFCLGGTTLK